MAPLRILQHINTSLSPIFPSLSCSSFPPVVIEEGEVLKWGLRAAEVATFCRQKLPEPWLIPQALFWEPFPELPCGLQGLW